MCMIEWRVRIRVAYLIESRGRIATMRIGRENILIVYDILTLETGSSFNLKPQYVSAGWCGTIVISSCQRAVYELRVRSTI